ncbi:HU family DNA-binding protein [Sphingomonas sp. 22176]
MKIVEFAKGVAAATGTTDTEAGKLVAAVFDQVTNAVAKGDEVSLR